MISYVSDEYRKKRRHSKQSLDEWMYKFVKNHDDFNSKQTNITKKEKIGYSAILEQCKLFSDKSEIMMKSDRDEKSILQEYKEFIGGYLYQAKVRNTILGGGQVRQTSSFETTVIFPAVLLYIYNHHHGCQIRPFGRSQR